VEEFESELGDVAVTKTFIEREPVESKHRELIEENFNEGEIVDRLEYENINGMHVVDGSMFPFIQFDTEDGMKRLFFRDAETAEDCLKQIRYNWHAYQQNY
jgi:hypothetical protein